MQLTRLALRRPVTAVMATASLVVLGAICLARLPLEFLPHVEFPAIWIYIPYGDAVPAQVERDIARPIEEAMATLGDVEEIESYSGTDECWVEVSFAWGRQIDILRMEVKEKLDQVRDELPTDIRDIFVLTFSSADIPILQGRISARGRDLSASYDAIERRVLNPLKRIPGVARVQLDGVAPEEVSIYLHLNRIKEHQVDVQRLFNQLAAAGVNLTIGRVTDSGYRYSVRAVGELASVEDLRRLKLEGHDLTLEDVATVIRDVPGFTYGRFLNGEPAVAFWINKESGANVVEVSRAVRAELERVGDDPALAGIDVVLFFDQGEQITGSLKGLLQSGLVGSVLAILVLYFFLRRIGTTLVVSAAIPLSVIATCVFIYMRGGTLNVLSMMGLMLAVGMLVDNAIVVLEAIHRRQATGTPPRAAALEGTAEVGRAVVASTLTSICVFAPVVLSSANEILAWLSEVGVVISATLVFSLLVSLTLIPLMAARLAGGRPARESRLVERLGQGYTRLLRWTALRHPWLTAFAFLPAVVLATVGAAVVGGFKLEPDSERGEKIEQFAIDYDFTDNLNYRATRDIVARVDAQLLAQKDALGVESVYSYYGDNAATTRLFFENTPVSVAHVTRVRALLRDQLGQVPGAVLRFGDEGEAGMGAERIAISLFGEDTSELGRLAREVKRRFELIDGMYDVRTNIEGGKDEVAVTLRRDRSATVGLTPVALGQILNLTFRGTPLPSIKTGQRELEMGVVLEPADRRNLQNLESLVVDLTGGREVTLGQVADFAMTSGPQAIRRVQQKTAVRVFGDYEGDDADEARSEVRRIMDGLAMPIGYSWNFGREFQRAQDQQNDLLVNLALAAACIFFVLASLFESLLHPLVIMSTIVFALLGVVWTMVLTSTPMNIMAIIGVVILIGIVVNNGIVLVDHINHFRRQGMSRGDAILAGGRERFRPVVMTALTTVLGLIPLAVGQASLGSEQYFPMARALMGGLVAGTALTLIVLPTFYVVSEKCVFYAQRAALWVVRRPGWLVGRFTRRRTRLSS